MRPSCRMRGTDPRRDLGPRGDGGRGRPRIRPQAQSSLDARTPARSYTRSIARQRVPAAPRAVPESAGRETRPASGIGEQVGRAPWPSRRVVAVDEHPGDAVARRPCAARRPRPRRPGCRRPAPRRDQPERLVVGRDRDEVGRAVPAGEHRRPHAAGGMSTGRPPRAPRGERGELARRPPGAARSAEITTQPRHRRAPGRASIGRAARSSTSGALSGWMRPTNSTTCASDAAARARRRAAPTLPPGRRGEGRRGRRRGRRRAPVRGVGVVQLDEVAGLGRRCWRPAGRPRRPPAPRRSPGPSARARPRARARRS